MERTPPKSYLARGHSLHLLYQLNTSTILNEIDPQTPPWRIDKLATCEHMLSSKKNSEPHNTIRGRFLDHLGQHHNQLHIYTDGSKTNQTVGYALYSSNHSVKYLIPSTPSIYSPELYAIRDAIEYATYQQQQYDCITIFTDSKSSIQGISNPFNRNPLVQSIQSAIISSNRVFTLCWVPSHVGIVGNEEADGRAGDVAYLPITHHGLPRSDHKNAIKHKIKRAWYSSWESLNGNKLKEILPNVPIKYIDSQPRQWSVKLNRLKIGHTRLTHEYLISREERPYCEDCLVPLTIKHLLIECPSFNMERSSFGIQTPTMVDIFNTRHLKMSGTLFNFLRQIGIYDAI